MWVVIAFDPKRKFEDFRGVGVNVSTFTEGNVTEIGLGERVFHETSPYRAFAVDSPRTLEMILERYLFSDLFFRLSSI